MSPYADLILIPCQPSPPDLVSIVPTVKVALSSGKLSFVLINRAPAVGNETNEAREAIEAAGVPVCPIVFYARKAFTSRFHEGLTAFDIEPKGKAAEEGNALFLWAAEKLGLIATKKDSKLVRKHDKHANKVAGG